MDPPLRRALRRAPAAKLLFGALFSGALFSGALFSGCSGPGPTLVVDLLTDYRPGFEFDRVEVGFYPDSSGSALDIPSVTAPPRAFEREMAASAGLRVAEVSELNPGSWIVVVRLILDSVEVGSGLVLVDFGSVSQAVTVRVVRECRGVECPADGSLTDIACLGGRCVDPRCSPESPGYCPPAECAEDRECEPAGSGCTVGLCLSGACGSWPDDALCAAGERCLLETGCAAELAPDAGVPDASVPGRDAGRDAGPADAGDAGVDGGPFVPRSIGGLVLWLRADTVAPGSVGTWADESGADNHAVATGVGVLTATVGGHRVVRVDGTQHLRTPSFTWGDDATVFVVASVDSGTAAQTIISTNYRVHLGIEMFWPSGISNARFRLAGDYSPRTLVDVGVWHIITVEDDTDVTNVWVDGMSRPDARHTAEIPSLSLPLGIGGNGEHRVTSERMTGAFAEVLIWDVALTAGQRAQVESYLRGRWSGLSIPTP